MRWGRYRCCGCSGAAGHSARALTTAVGGGKAGTGVDDVKKAGTGVTEGGWR
jgi:hypothetical protein